MRRRRGPFQGRSLALRGLSTAPSQVRGGVRLVPLIRERVGGDLRLLQRRYDEAPTRVSLAGRPLEAGIKYASYIPHGLVLSYTDDGSEAAYGAQLLEGGDAREGNRRVRSARILHRMVRRESRAEAGNTLRFLPMHLAMEGFLSLYFNGPEIAFSEYSRETLRMGLDPRTEVSVPGKWIPDLEDALRVFEIHDGQCGVVVYVADVLASAFVVPHPDDFRALHRTLLLDFYGVLLYQYGRYSHKLPVLTEALDDRGVSSLDDLRRELGRSRASWAAFHDGMAGDLLRRLNIETVYRAGPFALERFLTELDPALDNHIGESIVRGDGTVEYLKTYSLSPRQVQRAYLLQNLAAHAWNLDAAARGLACTRDQLVGRLERAGFGYLLKKEVLDAARKRGFV